MNSFTGRNPILDKICSTQQERIKDFKLPNIAQGEKLGQLLKCLEFILNNKDEILDREKSIELFGDSKLFEKEFKAGAGDNQPER